MYQKFAQLVSFFCFFIGFSFFALRKLLCKLSNLMYTIKKIELCEIYTFFLSILVFQKLFDIIFYCSPIWTFLRNHWTELYAPLRRRCWCRYVSFQVFFFYLNIWPEGTINRCDQSRANFRISFHFNKSLVSLWHLSTAFILNFPL